MNIILNQTYWNFRLFQTILTIVLIFACSESSASHRKIETANKTVNWGNTLQQSAQYYIVPRYYQLKVQTKQLSSALEHYCPTITAKKSITDTELKDIRNKLKALYLSWAYIQHINFGPISFLKRRERFQYWPDKHNVAGKQLRRLINNQQSLPTTEELSKKSVGIQGLPALETLIFSRSGQLSSRQCELALSISENLNNIAVENYQLWTSPPADFINEFTIDKYKQGIFSSEADLANTLLNSLTTQLSVIEVIKLPDFSAKKKINHRKLEAWKSQLSLALIKQNLISLKSHYSYTFHPVMKNRNRQQSMAILEKFTEAITITSSLTMPLSSAIKDASEKIMVTQLKQTISELNIMIKSTLKNHLNISTQFNALDGD